MITVIKKTCISKLSGTILLLLCIFLAPLSSYSSASDAAPDRDSVEITSDSMIAEDRNNIITFNGSVVARKDDIIIHSDSMLVHYNDKRELTRIIATGSVRLVQENKEISSEKAEYFHAEEKIVFTGKPVFRESGNTVTGSMITYIIPLEKSVVKDSRVILR